MNLRTHECDVLVIGSGAAGFATAITARKLGLDVLLVEKAPYFGGTSATSGGVLWIPGHGLPRPAGAAAKPDERQEQQRYLQEVLGPQWPGPLINAYLDQGPKMVDFFVNEVGIEFAVAAMPDYLSQLPGARDGGRSLQAQPVKARVLGAHLGRLRPPLREMTLFGLAIGSGNNLNDLYRFGRSVPATLRVLGRFARYGIDLLLHGRGQTLVNGNALVARLASAAFRLDIPVWTSAPAEALVFDGERVAGAVVQHGGEPVQVRARKGVVLASGGIAQDIARRQKVYGHPARTHQHLSLTAPGNTGDGARMAESAGGFVDTTVASPGAWMPTSKVARPDGAWGLVFHSVNTGKPGVIAVLRDGKRFVDESVPYHYFVQRMVAACGNTQPPGAFLICDQASFSRYGLGYAKPMLPQGRLLKTRYLYKAASVEDLAGQIGVTPAALAQTVRDYNAHAAQGQDPQFGKGSHRFGHYLGDAGHPLHPNLAPLLKAPFYAVWMQPGDIGSFAGVRTDERAQVLRPDGTAVPGLFAVGNDMASVFRGHYPGGGSMLGPGMTFGFVAAHALAAGPKNHIFINIR